MSYWRRNVGTIVFIFACIAFVVLYCINYYVRRCRDQSEETVETALSPRRPSPQGLDAESIQSFPSFVYTEANGIELGKGELECIVCLSQYKDHETLRLISPCGHVFHAHCVDIWLSYRSTCPICRADLVP